MRAIPTINAIKTLFVFFAIIPVTRALIAPGIPSEIILGTINESKKCSGQSFYQIFNKFVLR